MTTWNFRIIKHDTSDDKEVWFGIHEAYYNEKGEIESWTEEPILVGNSIGEVFREVEHIVNDLKRFPNAISLSNLLNLNKK